MNDPQRRLTALLNNPFPEVPGVTVGTGDERRVTVETRAVKEARKFVDSYIQSGGGRILGIVGDYGAGKSHLAGQVIQKLHEDDPGALISVLRARSEDTLCSLYVRIFEHGHARREDGGLSTAIRMLDVQRRVAEIRDETAPVIPADDQLADVPDVSDDLGLLRALQDGLLAIVQDQEFASGLSLLLHHDPAIVSNAWSWLRGGPVTSDLAKRGVREQIDNESRARTAMLVLARLINRVEGRFALVMDDIEMLGGDDARFRLASVLNLLIDWAGESGSLLVLSSVARPWQDLPSGVRQRVGQEIRPSPFTKAEIARYPRLVYQHHHTVDGPRFVKSATDRLHDITGGSPRQVVRACYQLFRRAIGGQITDSLTEQVCGEIFVRTPPSVVAGQIIDQCALLGLHASSTLRPSGGPGRVRIPVGNDGAEILIVIGESVVNATATALLIRLSSECGDGAGGLPPGDRAAVLVCTGPVAESQGSRLRDAFTAVLRSDRDDFLPSISVLISNLVAQLDKQAEAGVLHEMRDDLRSLRAQQAAEHGYLRQLAGNRDQEEQRLREVIREEARRAYLRLPAGADTLDFGTKLPELQGIFDDALSPIREALERVEQLWRAMYLSREPTRLIDRSQAPGGRAALPSDLTPEPMIRSLGVLAALDSSLRGFGLAVIGLIRDGAETPAARAQMTYQCTSFDKTAEALVAYIPVLGEDANSAVYRVLGIDRAGILARLKGLGAAVFDEVYKRDFFGSK